MANYLKENCVPVKRRSFIIEIPSPQRALRCPPIIGSLQQASTGPGILYDRKLKQVCEVLSDPKIDDKIRSLDGLAINSDSSRLLCNWGNRHICVIALDELFAADAKPIEHDRIRMLANFNNPTRYFNFLNRHQVLLWADAIQLLDFNTKELTYLASGATQINCCTYHEQKHVLLSGGADGHLRKHDLQGKILAISDRWDSSFLGGRKALEIIRIIVTPDGNNVLTGSNGAMSQFGAPMI